MPRRRPLPTATHPKHGYPVCGAKKRQGGGTCTQKAGWGTDHVGKGRCKLHGGVSGTLTHGRYSQVSDKRLAQLIEEIRNDPNPLDVVPELGLARALLRDWLERYGELRDALLRWNAAAGDGERPARILELQDVVPLIDEISKIAYRIERATSDKYIPRGQFYRVMQAMGRVVDLRAPEEVAEAIREDWLRIEIP